MNSPACNFESELTKHLSKFCSVAELDEEALKMAHEAVIDPASDYYYLKPANVTEAVTELLSARNKTFEVSFAKMIADENLDTAKVISSAVKQYWITYAQERFYDELSDPV
jgi:methenyltetrahydromethanopterin cyclohydrolase